MTEAKHSKYSASGFEASMLCAGKTVLEAGLPRSSSKYADEGTCAHQVFEWCLTESRPASAYTGRRITVAPFTTLEVTKEMAEYLQPAVDQAFDFAQGGMLLAEQRVCYAPYLGVPDDEAWGTSDAIIIRDDELIVVDLKYGMGVQVDAERNPQMMLYALGALNAVGETLGPFTSVRMVILQPRLNRVSEWACTVEELETWGRTTARSAVILRQDAEEVDRQMLGKMYLTPGEKQCKFCCAKATCPALRNDIQQQMEGRTAATPEEFDRIIPQGVGAGNNPDWLAHCLAKVDLIEDWCKAVRAEAERRLLAGEPVPGFKVVAGKRGARTWSDPEAAEKLLRETFRLRVEDAYDLKLISPTTAEKRVKAGVIGPRQWPKLESLITQSDGKPHVAPMSDNRPALDIRPVADDFQEIA